MPSESKSKYLKDVGVGLISGVILIPIGISFCSIIFRDQEFSSVEPALVKLVLFSSVVHQLVFTTFSTLPFAVGQVQDAGLIFLSAIASDIASCYQANNDMSFYDMIATVLVCLSLSTAVLGTLLIITGKLKLASMMQYFPMPVIGGYLAFIGFFCGQAGVAMMASVEVCSHLRSITYMQYV